MNKNELVNFLRQLKNTMEDNREYLIELDSIVGDGDLGLTMSDGFRAAYEAVKDLEETDAGRMCYTAGKVMAEKVPSTMGTLMASGLIEAGKELRDKEGMKDTAWIIFFKAYETGVCKRGHAKVGDKTFLDAFHPACEVLESQLDQGAPLEEAARKASAAAETGFYATAALTAVHGRAAAHRERSGQTEDAGAAVAMLMVRAFADSMAAS